MLWALLLVKSFGAVVCDDENLESFEISNTVHMVPAICTVGGDLCNNEATDLDCSEMFELPKIDVSPPQVDKRCTVPSTFAKMCAKTCLLCCQLPSYDCEDKTDPPIPCKELRSMGLCTTEDDKLRQQIKNWCPQTCGLCTDAADQCLDKNILHCKSMQRSCDDPEYKDFLKYYCPRTCEICEKMRPPVLSSHCIDFVSYCAKYSFLCESKAYESLVANQCQSTCQKCSTNAISKSAPDECIDRLPQCAKWLASGFCTSSLYTKEEKLQVCAKTCGLC